MPNSHLTPQTLRFHTRNGFLSIRYDPRGDSRWDRRQRRGRVFRWLRDRPWLAVPIVGAAVWVVCWHPDWVPWLRR